jgi:hypothetical protein
MLAENAVVEVQERAYAAEAVVFRWFATEEALHWRRPQMGSDLIPVAGRELAQRGTSNYELQPPDICRGEHYNARYSFIPCGLYRIPSRWHGHRLTIVDVGLADDRRLVTRQIAPRKYGI